MASLTCLACGRDDWKGRPELLHVTCSVGFLRINISCLEAQGSQRECSKKEEIVAEGFLGAGSRNLTQRYFCHIQLV